jgi:tetratricopeptide (TPR) repeat protein
MRKERPVIGVIFALLAQGAITASAQASAVQIRTTGEHKAANGETPAAARQFALVDAMRKAWQEAAAQLQDLPDVKAFGLKPSELEAFIAATLVVEEQPVSSPAGRDQTYRVDVSIRFDPAVAARRVGALHKDQETAKAVVDKWREMQALIGNLGSEAALTEFRVKHLAAQVFAALGKTEESFGSARIASAEERARAKQLAETAISLGPELADAHYAMGDVLADSGDVKAAEAEFRKALTINPESSFGHSQLANALRLEGNLSGSIAELRETLRLDPTAASAHTDLGLIYGAQGNTTEAIAEYEQALRLDPDFIDAHNNLAIAFARQQRIPAAVEQFREVVRVDPDSAMGYYNLGVALADMEKDQESAAALREVVRINPNHYNAHFNLGELFRIEEKYDDAVKQFREYLRLAPDSPQTQRNIRRAKDFIQTHENH